MDRIKNFKQAIKGHFTHILILVVDNNYFTNSGVYLSQEKWEFRKIQLEIDF